VTVAENPALWLSLLGLGAAHGINPAMGWLFAVGRGLQERDRRAVWRALGPLALGHAAAIGAAVVLTAALGRVMPLGWLKWALAAMLLAIGVRGLVRHRHVRLGGMRVNARELAVWSFLMASAHGAGLMVVPLVIGTVAGPSAGSLHHHHAAIAGALPLAAGSLGATAFTVPIVHTLGYLVVTLILAVAVYEKLGLRILRRGWINLDVFWSAALILAALATVVS
jgi:hypothetical protein